MNKVIATSKKCLCVLVNNRNDSSHGFKVNITLSENLPALCESPVSYSDCPALLNMDPNSSDAKGFAEVDKSIPAVSNGQNGTLASSSGVATTSSRVVSAQVSDGARDKITLGGMMFSGVLIGYAILHSIVVA
ncbi:hypothetical protein GIB67_016902 [Kingdonia uniflora]|uniref:Uncharacterized protein n=1 Tax=Kingdonia uniflora TaxID=39325 RepID=A0A7J7M3J6_9MAGN|nr:hypothetical protein GIB67_016902 [Kingdonia uniflora]